MSRTADGNGVSKTKENPDTVGGGKATIQDAKSGFCGYIGEDGSGSSFALRGGGKKGKGKVVNGENGVGAIGEVLQTGYPNEPTEEQQNRNDLAQVCVLWQKSYGMAPTAHIKEELRRLLLSRGKIELKEAICIASEHNKVTLAYVKGILKNKAAGTLSPNEQATKKKKDSRNKYASMIEEALRP